MKLTELYAQISASQHHNIVVAEGKVFVKSAEGIDDYLLLGDGELFLLRSAGDNSIAAIR